MCRLLDHFGIDSVWHAWNTCHWIMQDVKSCRSYLVIKDKVSLLRYYLKPRIWPPKFDELLVLWTMVNCNSFITTGQQRLLVRHLQSIYHRTFLDSCGWQFKMAKRINVNILLKKVLVGWLTSQPASPPTLIPCDKISSHFLFLKSLTC